MKIISRYATQKHFNWLKTREHHISEATLKGKIDDKEIIIIQSEGVTLGWLRFGFFWDEIPFLNMLVIEEGHRCKGLGKRLLQFWESEMREQKYKIVMTSSQSDEEAQHFYRKLGYADAGTLTLPEEPVELIFTKEL